MSQPSRRLPPLANTTPVWRRSWIAVARAEEVPDNAPVQVLVAGDAWVVTRMDGVLTAFEDHCPHRQSPLSAGAVTRADDGSPRLTCAFHGWRFDASGHCDLMPDSADGGPGRHRHGGGHEEGRDGGRRHFGRRGRYRGRHSGGGHGPADRPGGRVMLRSVYGIMERYGLVWLAVDEPLAPLPDFPEWADAAMDRAACQAVVVQAGAGQVIDGFLAPEAGNEAGSEAGRVATDGWRVTGVSEAPVWDGDIVLAYRAIKTAGPGATAHLRLELPHATIGILLTCQPEDWSTTRVYKLITRSDIGGDAALLEKFVKDEDAALAESLALLDRHTSALLPLDPAADPEPAASHPAESHRAPALNVAWRVLMARAVAETPAGLR